MFEDIWFYLLVFAISFSLMFIYRLKLGPFRVVLNVLGFIGIIVHELSHYLLCKLVGVPVKRIFVQYRNKRTGTVALAGAVVLKEPRRMSFLQALVTGFAPLFISSWLIMFCFDLLSNPFLEDYFYFFISFMIVSLMFGGAPSHADIRICYNSFKRSPVYSVYQIFLLFISIFTVVLYVNISVFVNSLEFLIYILQFISIGVIYFIYKYIFRYCNHLLRKLGFFKRFNAKLLTRKRHQPIKAHKIGIEETHR
jgi:hypothetical protein